MTLTSVLLLTTHLMSSPTLAVDFRLAPAAALPGRTGTQVPLEGEATDGAAESRRGAGLPTRKTATPSPSFTAARGFGADVPLSFAARQIVPTAYRVRYAGRVDPEATVTWSGDKPWNRALQEAIRPLGLRMTLSGSTVTISR